MLGLFLLLPLSAGAENEGTPEPVESAGEVPPPRMSIVDPDLVPQVKSTRPGKVVIRGLEGIEEAEARDLIRFQVRNLEESGVTMARADDAAFFLEESIRNRGFDAVNVTWEITSANDVVLSVEQGSEVFFGEVSVSGNENLSDAAIRELLTQATRKRLGYRADAPKIPYVADDVTEGVKAIQHIYHLMGYAEAEVEQTSTAFDPGAGTTNVSLKVKEGALRSIGRITFPDPADPGMTDLYTELETEFDGRPFTPAVAATLADRVVTAANEAGYHMAEVEVTDAPPRQEAGLGGEPSRKVIDLKVTAEWGDRYSLGKVTVEGTEKIQQGVIERRFASRMGQPYSPKAVNETIEELIETGAFEGLSFEALPSADSTIELKLSAEEAKRHGLGLYGGFGTYEGPILGIEYRHANFLGRLQTLQIEAEFSGRGLTGDIGYTNEWFLNSKWKLKLNALAKSEMPEGYEIFDVGFRGGLQREFGRKKQHRLTFFALPQYSEITDSEIDPSLLGPTEYIASRAGVIYSLDLRDDPLNPRKGFAADLILSGASSAIGSEVEFAKAGAKASYHLPLGRTTLRLGARAGIIRPGDDDDLPIDLRVFSGGARSVRSFRERDLGPHSPNNYPLGGEFGTIFNIEYDIPVAGPISVAPFLDAGNLLSNYEDASLDAMHYAGGAGLILNSPIGPLRIDYGHNLNQAEGEPSGSWHVGFGITF